MSTQKLLDCALIGVSAVVTSNKVSPLAMNDTYCYKVSEISN